MQCLLIFRTKKTILNWKSTLINKLQVMITQLFNLLICKNILQLYFLFYITAESHKKTIGEMPIYACWDQLVLLALIWRRL